MELSPTADASAGLTPCSRIQSHCLGWRESQSDSTRRRGRRRSTKRDRVPRDPQAPVLF